MRGGVCDVALTSSVAHIYTPATGRPVRAPRSPRASSGASSRRCPRALRTGASRLTTTGRWPGGTREHIQPQSARSIQHLYCRSWWRAYYTPALTFCIKPKARLTWRSSSSVRLAAPPYRINCVRATIDGVGRARGRGERQCSEVEKKRYRVLGSEVARGEGGQPREQAVEGRGGGSSEDTDAGSVCFSGCVAPFFRGEVPPPLFSF